MRRVVGAVVVMGMICLAGILHEWMVRIPPTQPDSRLSVIPTDSIRAPSPPRTRTAPTTPSSFLVDPLVFLSRAPLDSLDLLPGIGPVLAARIIEARKTAGKFSSWNEVLAIKGIGPRMIARWKALSAR